VAALLVVQLELSLGPSLLIRKTRPLGIVLATAFHLGNWVLLFIPEFLVCVAALVVFVDERVLERLVALITRAVRRVKRRESCGAA
jgi:hypothetical protein